MSEKIFLTKEQYNEFKEKLDYMYNVEIPRNAEDIARAVAQGDLSENAEYENAKEEQAKINQEIAKIKNILANASIIKQNNTNDYVEIGHRVVIESLDTKKEETITLMGYGNGEDTISIDAPLGKAVHGKKKGDIAVVEAPAGDFEFLIKDIQ